MKQNLSKEFNERKNDEYKRYRNKLTNLIKITKQQYYKEKIDITNKDPKKMWRLLKEVCNEEYAKSSDSNIKLNINNSIITDKQIITNEFNDFFVKIGEELSTKCKSNEHKYNKIKSINSLFLNEVTENELIKHIHSLKNNSSPGPDRIHTITIKNIHINILKPLNYIFNKIYTEGYIPKYFKESIVIPVYKNGDKLDKNNYRPISTINNFAKLLEKTLKERSIHFLETNNLLSSNQYGFRENKNTELAIAELTKTIIENINNDKKTIGIFLDLTKAFDTINHKKILEILDDYGFRGNIYKIYESYLKDRTQKVKIDDTYSLVEDVTHGLPQGTVLAPMLFIIYINNINLIDADLKIVSYADDTTLIINGKN